MQQLQLLVGISRKLSTVHSNFEMNLIWQNESLRAGGLVRFCELDSVPAHDCRQTGRRTDGRADRGYNSALCAKALLKMVIAMRQLCNGTLLPAVDG